MTPGDKKAAVMDIIGNEYAQACGKHPIIAKTMEGAFIVLSEEVGSVAKAINDNKKEEMVTEIAQVAAVCFRMLEMAIDKKIIKL